MKDFMFTDVTAICVVGLVMLVPIVTVIGIVWALIVRSRNDKALRQSIVENNVSPELARMLIEEKDGKSRLFATLRWGCALLGMGIGCVVAFFLPIDQEEDTLNSLIIIAAGMGLGLLVSFVVEMRIRKRQTKDEEEKQTAD